MRYALAFVAVALVAAVATGGRWIDASAFLFGLSTGGLFVATLWRGEAA